MKPIIVNSVSKSFDAVKALNNLSMEVDEGELYGLIGADGAGKSTLFRVLTTLILPDTGTAQILGYDSNKEYLKIREKIGYMPGRFSLYGDLSVSENLNFFAHIYGNKVADNYDLIKDIYTRLEPFAKRKAAALSGGMKQKLALCCTLIHRPSILFLDEPTTGVDPVSRTEFWDILTRLSGEGMTIVVSTPYMDEASRCNRMSLMSNGEITDTGTIDEIKSLYTAKLWSASADNMWQLLNSLRSFKGVYNCYAFGDSNHFSIENDNIDTLRHYLMEKGCANLEIHNIAPEIEDCFLMKRTTL